MDNPPSRKPPGATVDSGPDDTPPTRSDADLLRQCRVDTFQSGGPGGQHRNKVESAIRLTHLPTGVMVVSRSHRSQYRNRQEALRRLRAELERRTKKEKRRIPTSIPRAERERRLERKKRRARTKLMRKKPDPDDH